MPQSYWGNSTMHLEKTELTIGFVALSDCAPLVVALEQGFFAEQGLHVNLSREPSWANIRDKLMWGMLDAAQMLAPMPLAMSLGLGGVQKNMQTAFVLSLNGNAITVSETLYQKLLDIDSDALQNRPISAHILKSVLATEKLSFAHVFPFSMHHYQLCDWLAKGGVNPNQEVNLMVVPPSQMVGHLQAGLLDGFCVGAPWNNLAVSERLGHTLITGCDITPKAAEKVLGVTQDWAEQYPHTHQAVLLGLHQAARWLAHKENREAAAQLIAQAKYLDVPMEIARLSLLNHVLYAPEKVSEVTDFHVFYEHDANCPQPAQAIWILQQMQRWGQIDEHVNQETVAAQVYKTDVYQKALSIKPKLK